MGMRVPSGSAAPPVSQSSVAQWQQRQPKIQIPSPPPPAPPRPTSTTGNHLNVVA